MHENLHEHHKIIADKGQKTIRLDAFLAIRLENISRTQIEKAAKKKYIFVNNKPEKSSYKVKPNDIIIVKMPQPKHELKIIPEKIPLKIIYEDKYIIVINKDPGIVVHPAYGHYSGTLINALAYHVKDSELFKKNDIRPGLVHRIDKDTSGLLVIAKTETAKNKLAKQFFNHSTKRKYYAIAWGNFIEKKYTITGNIGRNPKNRKIMTVLPDPQKGKHAITHFKVIEQFNYVSLIKCSLETGRTHQIRVHLKHIGHPLFNDKEYGGDQILKGTTFSKYKQFIQNCFKIMPRQALHAKTLGFIHPNTNKEMIFKSELPNDFDQVLQKWRKYTANREI